MGKNGKEQNILNGKEFGAQPCICLLCKRLLKGQCHTLFLNMLHFYEQAKFHQDIQNLSICVVSNFSHFLRISSVVLCTVYYKRATCSAISTVTNCDRVVPGEDQHPPDQVAWEQWYRPQPNRECVGVDEGPEQGPNCKNLEELKKEIRRLWVPMMEDHQVLKNMVESTVCLGWRMSQIS